jgi:ABC-type nitrate/sulfonate/bicarbonate transport system ATPase subunit
LVAAEPADHAGRRTAAGRPPPARILLMGEPFAAVDVQTMAIR